MPDEIDYAWLARYFAGEMSAGEVDAVRRWIAAAPHRATQVDELRAIWYARRAPPRTWDAEAALQRVKSARLRRDDVVALYPRAADDTRAQAETSAPSRWAGLRGLRAGGRPRRVGRAAVLAAAAAAFAWVGRGALPRTPAASPLVEVATRRGQRATLRLADGSRVTLGVGSRLRYPQDYGATSRDLYLDGEAYFEVVHDARRPMRVHTRRAVTEDLGTAFGVRDYSADSSVQVVVAEGAVVLKPAAAPRAARDSLVLTRAELGRLDADGRLTEQADVDVDAHLAWTAGRLVFVNAPLRDVVVRLGQWYGLDVVLADGALAGRRFTGSFADEPAAQVLDLLALSADVRVERRGATVIVARKPARDGPAAERARRDRRPR
jgi:ferric-dicitrate binding protein FerR (iron transport regulator)